MDATLKTLDRLVDSVRKELGKNVPFYVDPNTLKNGCHLAAKDIYNAINAALEKGVLESAHKPRILRLLTPNKETHFVVKLGPYVADPSYSQYNPEATKFVWGPRDSYPLIVAKPVDVTEEAIRFWG